MDSAQGKNGHRHKFRCYRRFHDQGRSSDNFENPVQIFEVVWWSTVVMKPTVTTKFVSVSVFALCIIKQGSKNPAHSRILRLEREVLRPENLVQSQLCAWNPKIRRIIATRWTFFATRFGKQKLETAFVSNSDERDRREFRQLLVPARLGVDRKLSTCAAICRLRRVWHLAICGKHFRIHRSVDDPTCNRTLHLGRLFLRWYRHVAKGVQRVRTNPPFSRTEKKSRWCPRLAAVRFPGAITAVGLRIHGPEPNLESVAV